MKQGPAGSVREVLLHQMNGRITQEDVVVDLLRLVADSVKCVRRR